MDSLISGASDQPDKVAQKMKKRKVTILTSPQGLLDLFEVIYQHTLYSSSKSLPRHMHTDCTLFRMKRAKLVCK